MLGAPITSLLIVRIIHAPAENIIWYAHQYVLIVTVRVVTLMEQPIDNMENIQTCKINYLCICLSTFLLMRSTQFFYKQLSVRTEVAYFFLKGWYWSCLFFNQFYSFRQSLIFLPTI